MGEKRVIEQIASDEIYNDDWFLKDSVLHDTTKVQPSVIKEYVNQGMATATALENEATARANADTALENSISQTVADLADAYNTASTYNTDDVVTYSGKLYRAIADNITGTWDASKWEQVTVDELFDALNFSADAISYDNTSSGLEADNVQDAIDETITKLSAVGSASGDIATFPDGSDLPMPKLEVAIEPQQEGSGDPSPSNIRPISGWDEFSVSVSGVNVWDEDWTNGRWGGNNGVLNTAFSNYVASKNKIPIKPNMKFRFCMVSAISTSREVVWFDINKNYISDATETFTDSVYTVPSNAYYFAFNLGGAYGNTYRNDISINYPSTDTEYHAYNGHTYTIDLNGTRYGGKVDLVSGVMTVDSEYQIISSFDGYVPGQSASSNYFYKTVGSYGFVKTGEVLCETYKTELLNGTNVEIGIYCVNSNTYNDARIIVRPENVASMSISDFNAILAQNPLKVCYKTTESTTYQLTPTVVKSLKGVNNVWADTGAILDAEYIRDLTAIIDYILEQLNA